MCAHIHLLSFNLTKITYLFIENSRLCFKSKRPLRSFSATVLYVNAEIHALILWLKTFGFFRIGVWLLFEDGFYLKASWLGREDNDFEMFFNTFRFHVVLNLQNMVILRTCTVQHMFIVKVWYRHLVFMKYA